MNAHELASEWAVADGLTYLNHGSFGLTPRVVLQAAESYRAAMIANPMDFYVRRLEDAWFAARDQLARFLNAMPENLALVENATAGMNVVAQSLRLEPGDEVLLNDHEYGAVRRIWESACARQGTVPPVIVSLPAALDDDDAVVESIWSGVTAQTKLIVVSHITSPTAVTLPVAAICRRVAAEGIQICIDGPHAVAQLPLALDALGCDFYVASCHKWFCAPLGSGFIYATGQHHANMRPLVQSWGRIMPARPSHWTEEFLWSGTRDFSALLAIGDAVKFWSDDRLQAYRQHARALSDYASDQLAIFGDQPPLLPATSSRFCSMRHLPLPPGPTQELQRELWEKYQIEVPIIEWQSNRYIRVSSHLYNSTDQIDSLARALTDLLPTLRDGRA